MRGSIMSSAQSEGDAGEEIGVAGLDDEVVTIGRAELEELRALARASSRPARPAGPDAEAARREDRLARELADRDRRVAGLESAFRDAVRDRELATSLAGKPLVAGAATQLVRLWRDDLDVYEESGEVKVAARDGRPVAQWVAERLGHPDYAHFCLPPSRGGTGAGGLSQSGGPGAAPSAAKTLGEAVIARWRESAADRPAPTTGLAGWGRRG
jgi:hypothetical protein